jgi:hypothetical protein
MHRMKETNLKRDRHSAAPQTSERLIVDWLSQLGSVHFYSRCFDLDYVASISYPRNIALIVVISKFNERHNK